MTRLIYKNIKTNDFIKYVATAKNAGVDAGETVLFECKNENLWALQAHDFYRDYKITQFDNIPD